ncbi:MAG: hypothetical protein ABSB74_15470 [Tepidisphaeraceae bacterium]
MTHSLSPIADSLALPPELKHAIVRQAESDADAVIRLLDVSGIPRGTPMPSSFLLGLAAALRVNTWEDQGIFSHCEAGLPDARHLLVDLFRRVFECGVDELKVFGYGLCYWVLELATSRLAWSGASVIGADIIIGEVDEDMFVETLAQFVWANRHGGKQ